MGSSKGLADRLVQFMGVSILKVHIPGWIEDEAVQHTKCPASKEKRRILRLRSTLRLHLAAPSAQPKIVEQLINNENSANRERFSHDDSMTS